MVTSASLSVGSIRQDKETGTIKMPPAVAGFDTGKILEAVEQGNEAKLIRPQDRLDKTNDRHEAISKIQLVLQEYSTTLEELRGTNIIKANSGVFAETKPVFETLNNEPGSAYFSMVLDPGQDTKEVTIGVTKTAEKDSVKAATIAADKTTALTIIGTLDFPHKDGISPDVTVTFDGSESVADIASKVSAVKESTSVNAILIPSGTGYKLSFESTEFSKPLTFTKNITGGDATQIPDPSIKLATDLQAEITFQGEISKHGTNTVSLPGMTLTLFKETVDGGGAPATIDVSIQNDPTLVFEKMEAWAEKHNELLDLIDTYTKFDHKDFNISKEDQDKVQIALLASNSAVHEIKDFVSGSILKSIGGKTAASFGVTVDDGRIKFDSAKLVKSLTEDYKSVQSFFDYGETSTNPKISATTHPSILPGELTSNDVTVTVSKDGGGILTATFDYTGSGGSVAAMEVLEENGVITIKGDDNSLYKDFMILYDGTLANGASATTTMTFSQGIADQGVGFVEHATTNVNGSLVNQHESFKDDISDQEKNITKIRERNATMLAQLERKLSAAIQLISQILAMGNQVRGFEQQSFAAAAG